MAFVVDELKITEFLQNLELLANLSFDVIVVGMQFFQNTLGLIDS